MMADSTDSWYPSKWGADDTLGALNLITPERVVSALTLVKKGEFFELGRVMEQGMPMPEFHGQFFANTQYALENGVDWHELNFGKIDNGYSAQNLRISMSDQSGTHIDQVNHVGFTDDNGDFRVYNGLRNKDIITTFGTSKLGAELMPPIITRGVLADVSALHGGKILEAGYVISPEELDDALNAAGVQPNPGDALFVNCGWGAYWDKPAIYGAGEPGLSRRCSQWVMDREISILGMDNFGIDVLPVEIEGEALPVHLDLLTKHGVRLVENMYLAGLVEAKVYEFCLMILPLKIKGGTGSPVRPMAYI